MKTSTRIYLCTEPADMRKGFDGLGGLVRAHFGDELFSGHLFVFVNRRRTHVKVLFWDREGFALFYKRLEKGRLQIPRPDAAGLTLEIEPDQLALLLSGLRFEGLQRPPGWIPKSRR